MDTDTLKHPVFLERKVSAEADAVSYETSYKSSDQNNAIRFSKMASAGNQEVYQKINLTEQRAKETYRKVNKMLRGY